jgi:ribonuclease R
LKKQTPKDPQAKREAANYENPIPSRELISNVLDKSKGPMTHEQLCNSLSLTTGENIEALRRRLIAMVRDGQLITNRKGAFGLIGKMDLVRGCIQGHRDGFGFVIPSDGSADIYLSSREMHKVFDGDEVLVRADKEDFKGRREGSVVEVIAHNTHQLVGRYLNERGNHFVSPDNARLTRDIVIPPEQTNLAVNGQFVVVEIIQQPSRHQNPVGKIIEVLGNHMAPGMEIDVAIRSYGIPHTWPTDVQQQVEQYTAEVKEQDKQQRIDLRKLPFVTIDGEDARDFDDAVYCESKRSGGWRLYVAIADVSHYVEINGALDREAVVRGNSVYFPDHVVPMLPHVLSNGLCSLNPHVDRLCMVCEMTVSDGGTISGFTFYEAIMHSVARLTYSQVGQMIEGTEKARNAARKQFQDVAPHIDQLYSLYRGLRVAREARGAIDFESKETRIIFDEQRKIKQIVPTIRNEAHKLIEECMLAANVSAAKFLEAHKIPALYRVHDSPSAEKLDMLHEFLAELGLSMKRDGDVTPQDYRDVLSQVAERPDAHLIQTVMLRSMNQAAYQPENLGHFGLAYTAYAHFTSPIRRYPDLLVHRAIRAVIRSPVSSKRVKRHPDRPIVPFEASYPYSGVDMLHLGEQSSITERRADEATRDVLSWLKCEYLEDHVGEDFDGIVSAVTGFGLFVELKDFYVDGLVHITALPQDYYHHQPAQHRLVGEKTSKVFRLGDEVRVKVMRVNLDERKVDLELIKVNGTRKKATNAKAQRKKNATPEKAPRRSVRKRKPALPPVKSEAVESSDKNKLLINEKKINPWVKLMNRLKRK